MSVEEKNGCCNNETVVGMAQLLNTRETNRGNEFHCELKNVPSTFVNGLRRVLLSDIPTVVIRDVEILENTSQMPHEMLKHRVEMLPVNVLPTDASTIRDAKIELRILPEAKQRTLYNTDFVVDSARPTILMNDRDLGTPILFLRIRPNEIIHIRGRLVVETKTASQVCTATSMWHIDEDRAKEDKREFVEDDEGNPVLFDKFYNQRSYSRDENGRPDWFDLNVESVGVIPAKQLVKMSAGVLRGLVDSYVKEALNSIERQKDGEYRIQIKQGGHTVCALLQEVIYTNIPVNFVSYDIPHPLRSDTVLRFHTKLDHESVLKTAQGIVEEFCGIVEKSL
jgi:DNA-directed RNA polymerase subunit L